VLEEAIENLEQTPSPKTAGVFRKRLKVVIIFGLIFIVAVGALIYARSQVYAGTISPGVHVGPISAGGWDKETVRELLYDQVDALLTQGLAVTYKNRTKAIPLSSIGTDDPDTAQDYIIYDIDTAVEDAYAHYHSDNPFYDSLLITYSTIRRPKIEIPMTTDQEQILAEIVAVFPELAEPPVDAGFAITWTGTDWQIEVTEDAPGTVINEGLLFAELEAMLSDFSLQPIEVLYSYQDAEVSEQAATTFINAARSVLERAPYTLTYSNPYSWELSATTVANAIGPQASGDEIRLGLNTEDMQVHLDAIAAEVEVEAQDAHFVMDNGRVIEFVASHDGIELIQEETLDAIAQAWTADQTEIEIVVAITEPRVTTDEVNDLGITEVLGVGTSDFSGSPYNRIMNIKHGASKLNGILIAPDEEFSLLEALKPFTIADGYLPELVIRGDKIEPEVGGGLCQIGTTTFRTAMNSGMNITQRSNHSLVVSYYNDPSNGNPGTDATIYDPAPDFRFVNDTGNYVLFTTEADVDNRELTFTFWGTSDGRNAYYSAPVVTSWIPYGETQYIDTEDLEPGEEECQGAHIGANANFTYFIEWSADEVEETTYTSHYRPLPEICLVGIDPEAEVEGCEDEEDCEDNEDVEEAEEIEE